MINKSLVYLSILLSLSTSIEIFVSRKGIKVSYYGVLFLIDHVTLMYDVIALSSPCLFNFIDNQIRALNQ